MNKRKIPQTVILGGGLAGLASAYELSRAGKKVTVLEKWEDVGGLARTIKVGRFAFDTGPHRWYTKSNMVNGWMLKLLGKEVINVPRLTRIYFDKKFFFYPIKLKNAMMGIGLIKAFRAVTDYIIARLKSRLFPSVLHTMEDGYISQFGKTLYETFFKRYSEKLWGTNCRNISIDWVGQRTRGLNFLTILKESVFKSKSVVSLVDEFSYPDRGVGRIADKMVDFVKKSKGEIKLESEVVTVNCGGGKIVSVVAREKGGEKVYKAEEFISSIPLNSLVESLKPSPPAAILKTAAKLKYRDELQVALFIKKTHITPDTWIYVHPKEIPFMRVMEMDNWSSRLSPAGTTTMVFEVACNEGDRVWKMKDEQVINMIADSFISEFNLIKKEDLIGGHVHRVPKEYPVYHLDYKEDVQILKDYLRQFSNLQIIGRNGTFRYNNMDHSIEMGLYAAWNIIKGERKWDVDSVNIEREYLEEKKIETVEDELLEENGRK
ncbi:MAG: amine oxidase [Candidatus Gottesmanbacteria bacterium GW2011_GWA2_43_14]|uniref:Amine oxidase n=1 Tax=Candidatus Gottesmanbacteria bacterium GW2011_GWA2_43_14 TaxID=1618443 RepID=A0A0G1DLB9_9BACT|nr:MAG: amine oxidase [Candidatus Gottesmanbacteria bacterium GW2011_GWA2_43_14]